MPVIKLKEESEFYHDILNKIIKKYKDPET